MGVIIVQDRDILLVRHRRRRRAYWMIPGGQVKEFEALREAAVREIREKTGLQIRLGPLVAVFEISDRWWRHDINFVFSAESFAGALSVPPGGPPSGALDRG